MIKKIIIVDDHPLLSNGIRALIEPLPKYEVSYELRNGKELQSILTVKKNIPDIILLDINMPIMNGFETMEWLKERHPDIKVLALTINNDEESILKMLKLGVSGYLLKDTDQDEILLALDTVCTRGFYHNELVSSNLLRSLTSSANAVDWKLTEREQEFLHYVCTELTYAEIAARMFLSPKTIDHYRDSLFEKFQVKSRTGLVLFAIKNKLVQL